VSAKREEVVEDERTKRLAEIYWKLNELEERMEEEGENLLSEYRNLLKEFRETFKDFVRSKLRTYAEETNDTEVEFLGFVTDEGFALIVEGDEGRVSVPVKSAIAEVHTHPGICFPSSQDYKTAWHLLARGLVVFSVYSVECYFSLSLDGPFTEEDYVKLLRLSNEVKKVKTVEEYLEKLRSFQFNGLLVEIAPP
jgi:proteasome lid subunit RPN8/RPN11